MFHVCGTKTKPMTESLLVSEKKNLINGNQLLITKHFFSSEKKNKHDLWKQETSFCCMARRLTCSFKEYVKNIQRCGLLVRLIKKNFNHNILNLDLHKDYHIVHFREFVFKLKE